MKITESRLRSIIRQEIIKSQDLNEGLTDSLKSAYRKIFPSEDESTKVEKPKSEMIKFRELLDNRYSLERKRYGTERMVYLGPSKGPESIPPNIMRQYANDVYRDSSKSREEFLKQIPMNQLGRHEQKEIIKALDLVDSELKGKTKNL